MDIRLLIDVPACDDLALDRFQVLRQACRAHVRRHPTLGAALLFSGLLTGILLEGEAADLAEVQASLASAVPGPDLASWSQLLSLEPPRALAAGSLRIGYLSDEQGNELLLRAAQPPAARVRHFLDLLARSDHD